MLNIILGFALTGLVGTWLTNHYATLQNKREAQERRWLEKRSFIDALNTTKVAKIAEVWEQLFMHEAMQSVTIDDGPRLLAQIGDAVRGHPEIQDMDDILASQQIPERVKQIVRTFKERRDKAEQLATDARAIANKNRLWLGEHRYEKIFEYLNLSMVQSSAISPDNDLSKRKAELRERFESLREQVWNE